MVRKQILEARAFLRGTLLDKFKEVRNNDRIVLTLTYHPFRIFRMSLMRHTFFWHLTKNMIKILEINLLWLEVMCQSKDHLVLKLNVNHLHIIKVSLVVGLDAKFVLLLRKLKLFKTRIIVKHLTLERGFWTVIPIWLFTWLNVDHVLSSIWVVLLNDSVPLEMSQKLIPRNVISIKSNFISTLTLMDTMRWRTGRLMSLIKAENALELRHRESYCNTGLIHLFLMGWMIILSASLCYHLLTFARFPD